MPAVRGPLRVEAGSYEPVYWLVTDPQTGDPIDLTAPGFEVTMVVEDRYGTELLALDDADVFRRTADGRVYFEPSSTLTTTWSVINAADYQIELAHPSEETVRIGYGPFSVDREFVKD